MPATSRDAARILYKNFNRSKDLLGNLAHESADRLEDFRQWVPEHPTAVAGFASAAVGAGVAGFLLGRRRAPQRATEKALASAARMPELDIAPFFKLLKLWMLYRIATKD